MRLRDRSYLGFLERDGEDRLLARLESNQMCLLPVYHHKTPCRPQIWFCCRTLNIHDQILFGLRHWRYLPKGKSGRQHFLWFWMVWGLGVRTPLRAGVWVLFWTIPLLPTLSWDHWSGVVNDVVTNGIYYASHIHGMEIYFSKKLRTIDLNQEWLTFWHKLVDQMLAKALRTRTWERRDVMRKEVGQ